MPFLFLVAGVVTVLLGLLLVGTFIVGLVLCFVPRLRGVAPFIMFMPTCTALGAGGGAWGLGYAAHAYAPMSALPLWGWVAGLLLGAAVGLLLGATLALLTSKALPQTAQRDTSGNSRPAALLTGL